MTLDPMPYELAMMLTYPAEHATRASTQGGSLPLWAVMFVVSTFVMLVLACVAAVLRPPSPLSTASVLGRHIVGLARFLVAFIGFLGGLLLTTIIAAGGSHWATPSGLANLTNELWMIFLTLAATAAYVYWLWTAIDLIRLGRKRRRSAVDWWYRRWLSRLGSPRVERVLRAVARAIVSGPWWVMLITFYVVPLISILSAMELILVVVSAPAG